MTNPVIVVGYDPSWPETFQALRNRFAGALSGLAAAIEHVGSTAIPGLAAKPIINIDVLLASDAMLDEAIERLAGIGYTHRGNLGVPEREAFFPPAGSSPHHLYVCPPQSVEFRRHIAFRDYLRSHQVDAKAYGDLKMALARQFRADRTAYNEGKTEFVLEVLAKAMGDR